MFLWEVKKKSAGGKKRSDGQEEVSKGEESTITPSIIVFGTPDVAALNNGGFVAGE